MNHLHLDPDTHHRQHPIVSVVLIVWWLVAAATGPEAFAWADWFLRSWLGDLVLLGSLWALWYHALAGF